MDPNLSTGEKAIALTRPGRCVGWTVTPLATHDRRSIRRDSILFSVVVSISVDRFYGLVELIS